MTYVSHHGWSRTTPTPNPSPQGGGEPVRAGGQS